MHDSSEEPSVDQKEARERATAASNRRGATFVVAILFILPLLALVYHFQTGDERRVRSMGKLAPATILRVEDTGNRYNRNPEIELTLRVRPNDREPFRAVIREVISVVDVPRYQEGAEIQVRFDPEKPELVVLDGAD